MSKHHTKTKGDLGVVKVTHDLSEKGYDLFFPVFTEHLPFDLIAYKDKTTYRIQVKYRSCDPVDISGRTYWSDKNGTHMSKYAKNDFDYYAIYIPDIDKVIYPNISFAGKSIRIKVPESTTVPFYWYEDFLQFTDSASKKKLKDFGMKIESKLKGVPNIIKRKIGRPSKEELQKLLWEKPTIQLAKEFGVSDKAIEKWAKSYGIEKPPRGYWSKSVAQNKEAVKR